MPEPAETPSTSGAPLAGQALPISPETIALLLRVGLGLVLLSGGMSKLSQLLDPAQQAAIIASYWGPTGYVNTFFDQYLFDGVLGTVLTPWSFLTALSTFELMSGAFLLAGLIVRPLSLIWGFTFWSFLAALPVATSVGIDPGLVAYRSPALFVLIRDVGLSGLFFGLFMIGAGRYSADQRLFGDEATRNALDWGPIGLLVRLSIALPLLVGGAFHGMANIQSFGMPAWLLVLLAGALLLNAGVRWAGAATAVVMAWLILADFDLARSVIANMNAVKREYAFFAAAIVLAACGGGRLFSVRSGWDGLRRLLRPGMTNPA